MKRIAAACLTAALAAFGAAALAGCGPSNEEIVRQGVTEELEAVKALDPALLDEMAANEGLAQLAAYGIDAKEFVSSYLAGFDYRVDEVKVDGDTAQATVVLTCKSFNAFATGFTEAVTALSADESVPNMGDEEVDQLIGQTVMDTLAAVEPTETAPVTLAFELKDNVWSPTAEAEQVITEALFGN